MGQLKRPILVFLLSAYVISAYAQDGYFTVKEIAKTELSFPIFSRTGDTSAVKNINQFLQLAELNLLNGYQTKNIFEKLNMLDSRGFVIGKTYISYHIYSNNPRSLSIKLNETAETATAHYWVKCYNFNSGNGDLIQLKDLFTINGYEIMRNKIIEKRTAEFIKQGDSSKFSASEVLDIYKFDDLQDYYIGDTTLQFDRFNCLPKGAEAIFPGLNMLTTFNLSEFKTYLNNYGRTVFGITHDSIAKYRSYELPQLFEGTIGSTLPIIIVINSEDIANTFDMPGVYAYVKYGQGIFLEGTFDNNKLTVSEKTDILTDKINGYINATFDGKEINGTWTDGTKTKTLKFVAKRR